MGLYTFDVTLDRREWKDDDCYEYCVYRVEYSITEEVFNQLVSPKATVKAEILRRVASMLDEALND